MVRHRAAFELKYCIALQRFEYCIALKRFEYYILLNKGKLLLLGLELNHGGHFSLTWLASITIFQNMDWSNGQCALLGSVDSLILFKILINQLNSWVGLEGSQLFKSIGLSIGFLGSSGWITDS